MATYSHSKLETYRNCPHRYKLRYIDRVPDAEQGIEAFMGGCVHKALELLYEALAKEHPVTLEDVLARYELVWDEGWNDAVKVVRAEYTANDYRDIGRRCIRDYWSRHEPFERGVVVGIERKVRLELDRERGVFLQGYVDRIDRVEDGVFEIHDYKTGQSLPDQDQADADPQLGLYQLALEAMWPDQVRDVTLVWHYLAFDSEIRSRRKPEALEQLKADTLSTIDKIEADTEFVPAESNLCEWCGYQDLCPRKMHPRTVERLPPREFSADEGVKLVDEYVRLSEQKAEFVGDLDRQIEAAKRQLVEFARANGFEVVTGSDQKVTIKAAESITVPKKGSEERSRLESAIRAIGKWEELSCLDTSALSRALRDTEWDEEARAALGEHISVYESYRVTRSRLRAGGTSS